MRRYTTHEYLSYSRALLLFQTERFTARRMLVDALPAPETVILPTREHSKERANTSFVCLDFNTWKQIELGQDTDLLGS